MRADTKGGVTEVTPRRAPVPRGTSTGRSVFT